MYERFTDGLVRGFSAVDGAFRARDQDRMLRERMDRENKESDARIADGALRRQESELRLAALKRQEADALAEQQWLRGGPAAGAPKVGAPPEEAGRMDPQPVETFPIAGATPVGRTQIDSSVTPDGIAPAPPLPPMQPMQPGMMQAGLRPGGAQPAAQPTGQPAGQPGLVPRNELQAAQRQADFWNSRYEEAGRMGRPDLQLRALNEGRAAREAVRAHAFDVAETRLRMSGGTDFSGFIDTYNRYTIDGTRITGITPTKGADGAMGYEIRAVGDDGREVAQRVSSADMRSLLNQARDPAAARALEQKRAEMLLEHQQKLQLEEAKRDPIRSFPADHTVMDTRDGRTLRAGTLPSKGFDHTSDGIRYSKDTGDEIGGGANTPAISAFPKVAQDQARQASSLVHKNNGASDMAGLDPSVQTKVRNEAARAESLVLANSLMSDTALSPAEAARIASQIESGALKLERVAVRGGGSALGVVVDGRVILANPSEALALRRGMTGTPGTTPRPPVAQEGLGPQYGRAPNGGPRVTGQIRPANAPKPPEQGAVVAHQDGTRWRFKGADPSRPENWERVQ